MDIPLRNDTSTSDARLDRITQFDERSRAFPVAGAEATQPRPRSYTWRIGKAGVPDQGAEGACVGFAILNELLARPAEVRFGGLVLATRFARESIYWAAQRIDPWPGGAYPGAFPRYEGTSILAGVKIAQGLGFFRTYRWAFSLRDLVLGVGHNGPAVIGVNWYDSMYRPDAKHFIRPQGQYVGGHAILVRAVKLAFTNHRVLWWKRTWTDVDLDKSYVTLRNSWGPTYGDEGDCYMTLRDLEALLAQAGEAVFFEFRTTQIKP